MKIAPMSSDDSLGFQIQGNRQNLSLIPPGEQFKYTIFLQHGPMAFARLHLGPHPHLVTFSVGPLGISEIAKIDTESHAGSAWDPEAWRIDEVTIDDSPVDHRQVCCGVGSHSSLRVTNVGDVPAHFYAYWELEDLQ